MSVKKKKPYLGPILLAWCDHCNVPLAKGNTCARCKSKTRPVKVTPPGDARPAFQADRNLIRDSISAQYNMKIAEHLIPEDKIILLNAIPDIDCCEEIIVDGWIIGLHRFHVDTLSWEFIPKMEGARRIAQLTKKKQVVIEDSAVEFIVKGANLLRPGIKAADPTIRSEDYVIGVTEQGLAVLVGIAAMPGEEMLTKERGVAVKKRYRAIPLEPHYLPSGQTWATVLEANARILYQIEDEAIGFIQKTAQDFNLPKVVAFSGGKDSLAVLLLVKKALLDQEFHVMFIDTGIEFPETTQNVYSVIDQLGLQNQFLIKSVDKDQFFRVLEVYGFVARDYRVCCKSVKLGPTSQLIEEHFPSGCLSYIGQRRYESHRRAAGGRIWNNPWVPKQIGASPVHNWTALMIWLYLFQEKAPYNPLYEEGFERIGCMFCPASTMSELEVIASRFPTEWQKWITIAEKIAKKEGLTRKWLKHGFWRWKTPPVKIRELADKLEIELPSSKHIGSKGPPSFKITEERDSKTDRAIIKGQFNSPVNLILATAFLPALGEAVLDLDRKMIEVSFQAGAREGKFSLFKSGLFTLIGEVTKKDAELFAKTVLRGLICTSCGTCQSLCSSEAITLESGRARIIVEACSQCGKCLKGKCATLYAL